MWADVWACMLMGVGRIRGGEGEGVGKGVTGGGRACIKLYLGTHLMRGHAQSWYGGMICDRTERLRAIRLRWRSGEEYPQVFALSFAGIYFIYAGECVRG